MEDFIVIFDERTTEINAYLDLLDALDQQVQAGIPQLAESSAMITVTQQQILYSSVFIQLYSLVESTMTWCLDALSKIIIDQASQPQSLSINLRNEWVRFVARTHTELNYEHRLNAALELFEHLIQQRPISDFQLEKGGGGNWDDEEIFRVSKRLGVSLTISDEVNRSIKRRFRNDQGTLKVLRIFRNQLSHGKLSFSECGEGFTINELHSLKESVFKYLKEVLGCFQSFIDSHEYLVPEYRPSEVE